MYLFKQFCVHVQQPPTSSQSFNTVPLTPEKFKIAIWRPQNVESVLALWHVYALGSEVVSTIFWWAAKAGLQGDF